MNAEGGASMLITLGTLILYHLLHLSSYLLALNMIYSLIFVFYKYLYQEDICFVSYNQCRIDVAEAGSGAELARAIKVINKVNRYFSLQLYATHQKAFDYDEYPH